MKKKSLLSIRALELFVTGLGVGRSPILPGTLGTLWGVGLVFLLRDCPTFLFLILTALSFLLSCYLVHIYEMKTLTHDQSEVIVDEIVGYMVTMLFVPIHWKTLLLAFFLFRLFDMLKPFPVSYFDKHVTGGFGVVMDDVVAGIIANLILHWVLWNTTWLGILS